MANSQTCYYPNSTVSPDVPCHSDDTESACCNVTDTCLSNGLCLAQGGSELISRGSCTDESWGSPACAQYCADVNPGGGALIFLAVRLHDEWQFCCSPFANDTCTVSTKGSYEPFPLEAGHVIFNRTSGSTATNVANASTVPETATTTVYTTATASTSPSKSSSVSNLSLSCSNKEAAVGAGLGVTLGLALLVALGLLWVQRKHKRSLRTDVRTWEWKYNELTTRVVTLNGAHHQPIHQLPGCTPGELEGQPKALPSEMAERPR